MESKETNRFDIIKIIRTPLAFYVFIALIAEAVFGSLALSSKGETQIFSLYALILISLLLVLVVTVLTIYKPGFLLGNISSLKDTSEFCKKIEGAWWERVSPDDSSALSLVNIIRNFETGTPVIQGTTYNLEGDLIADWSSEASCVNLSINKVWYYWKGYHISRPEIPYGGFGEITFDDSDKPMVGKGLFSDSNFMDLKTTCWKTTVFRKCTDKEHLNIKSMSKTLLKDYIKQIASSM